MEAVVPVAISVLGKSKFSEVMKTEITLQQINLYNRVLRSVRNQCRQFPEGVSVEACDPGARKKIIK